MTTTIHELVEDKIYVSHGEVPMSGGDAVYQQICAWRLILTQGLINQWEHKITSR